MTNGVKIALIIGGASLIAIGALIFFSPYQSCVRANLENGEPGYMAHQLCARN